MILNNHIEPHLFFGAEVSLLTGRKEAHSSRYRSLGDSKSTGLTFSGETDESGRHSESARISGKATTSKQCRSAITAAETMKKAKANNWNSANVRWHHSMRLLIERLTRSLYCSRCANGGVFSIQVRDKQSTRQCILMGTIGWMQLVMWVRLFDLSNLTRFVCFIHFACLAYASCLSEHKNGGVEDIEVSKQVKQLTGKTGRLTKKSDTVIKDPYKFHRVLCCRDIDHSMRRCSGWQRFLTEFF